MALVLQTPIKLRIRGLEQYRNELLKALTYVDKKVDYQLKKFKAGSSWFIARNGEQAFADRLAELQASRTQTLLFEDEEGLWTYAGLADTVASIVDQRITNEVEYPKSKAIPWAQVPDGDDRYYQTLSEEKLSETRHAGVEIATGAGKSRIIRNLLKRYGLPAVIMAPSVSIADQLFDDLTKHFGKAKVGAFFDGKKDYKKQFVVGVAASLTKIREGSPIWGRLSQAQIFIADESHLTPASTLAAVCHGLLANAPYRWFFSGTQIRNDGLDTLLQAITGPIVFRMSVQDCVDQGFLARPIFRNIRIQSPINFDSHDANDLTRAHVYYSPKVVAAAAEITNKAVGLMGRPTLVLVDELEQFGHLAPLLRFEARFAHGGVNKDNKAKVPEAFHESDPKKLVADFNAGVFPILVGTSCVATGTDFKSVRCIVYLRGGKSEIELKQAIGRGTRLAPGKTDFVFVDFSIDNVETLARHAKERRRIYDSVFPSYAEMKLG